MSHIHLYTTFYNDKNLERQEELVTCINNNIENHYIATFTVFNEADSIPIKSPKLREIIIKKRPTYNDFIEFINAHTTEDDINIIANTDIYFDKNIEVLKHINLKDTCLALSRWDTADTIRPKLYNRNDSQDVWVFKGPIKNNLKANFPLGVARCDNRLLYELQKASYTVLNTAYSIKSFHLHKRHVAKLYTDDDNFFEIEPPFRYMYPHNLFGFWKTCFFNLKHKEQLGAYHYDIKKLNNLWVVRLPRKLIEVLTNKKLPLIGYKL